LAFAVIQLLAESGELSVGEIARALGRSAQRVSTVLGTLRVAEVVRYNADGRRNRYRLKHPGEIKNLIKALSRFVKAAAPVRG
jgi:DNA-binding IclR family transcriptional regulator